MIHRIKKFISSFLVETTLISPAVKTLDSPVVIVTGASRGIGKAIVQVLLSEGAKVVAVSRHKADLDKAFGKSANLLTIQADITSDEDVNSLIASVLKICGRIDVVVNNAGKFLDKNLEAVSEVEFTDIINVNIKGMFLVSKAVIPHMKKQKSGLLINIGSKISHNTQVAPKKVLYATTKYAVEGFSLALQKELQSFGIRVTCLMPGTVNTFVSVKSKEYLAPLNIGFVIALLIKCPDIEFESIRFKSVKQNI